MTGFPEAAGLARTEKSDTDPHAGVRWGLGHKLNWDAGPKGWMYIYRFDNVSDDASSLNIVPEVFQLQKGTSRQLQLKLKLYNATASGMSWTSDNEGVATVDQSGNITGVAAGETKVYVTAANGFEVDSCKIVVQNDEFTAYVVNISANSFTSTGGSFQDTQVPYGFNKTSSGVNWVNTGDWGEYEVDIPAKGSYVVEYSISSPSDNAEVSLELDDMRVTQDNVPNNGAWDSYYSLYADNVIDFAAAGQQVLKLVASGSNDWQWNMKSFELSRVAGQLPASSFLNENLGNNASIYFNKGTNCLHVSGIEGEYYLRVFSSDGRMVHHSKNNKNVIIPLRGISEGMYLATIDKSGARQTLKFVV